MTDVLRIGTRGSALALTQARWVLGELEKRNPGLRVELVVIHTKGDKILDVPLAKVGGKGLFVKEIEEALIREEIDLAVHSMKDLPAVLPDGLFLAAIPEREDPRDVLISATGGTLDGIPHGGAIGTGSLRRKVQLLARRPDLRVLDLRGNLDTRLRKLTTDGLDGIVLASAGLRRMGWSDRIHQFLPTDVMIPAVGQGALGIEMKRSRSEVCRIVEPLDHLETRLCVEAERAFLARLEGGCQVPIAGHAVLRGGTLRMEGLISDLSGTRVFRGVEEDGPENGSKAGTRLAERLLREGGARILKELYADG